MKCLNQERDETAYVYGNKESIQGLYQHDREFDKDWQPVRDIDFTDPDELKIHVNPHQHRYKENPTGGTRSRGKEAEPLPEWENK